MYLYSPFNNGIIKINFLKLFLDIFMGSGMTAKVYTNLSQNFYGCELDEK